MVFTSIKMVKKTPFLALLLTTFGGYGDTSLSNKEEDSNLYLFLYDSDLDGSVDALGLRGYGGHHLGGQNFVYNADTGLFEAPPEGSVESASEWNKKHNCWYLRDDHWGEQRWWYKKDIDDGFSIYCLDYRRLCFYAFPNTNTNKHVLKIIPPDFDELSPEEQKPYRDFVDDMLRGLEEYFK